MAQYNAGEARATYALDITQFEASVARVKARYAELAALQKQAATPPPQLPGLTLPAARAPAVPRTPPGGVPSAAPAIDAAGRAAAQTEKDILRYASSLAGAQRAQGDLSGAVQTYRTALSQLTPNTIEANRATAGLARAQRDLENSARSGAGGLNSLNTALGVVGSIAAAAGIARATGALVQLGAQAQQTDARFQQLARQTGTTGDLFLTALRQASGGAISDTNLQLDAMKANLLGVGRTAEDLGPLLAIARDRAQQMGITVDFAFDSLVTGLGRGSRLILDNIGVIVKVEEVNEKYAKSVGKTVAALTEEEKKQALVNEVLRQGNETIAATGGALDLTNTKIERVNANLDNLKARAGGGLANLFSPAIEGAARLTGGAQDQAVAFESLRQSQSGFFGSLVAGLPVFGQVISSGQNTAQSIRLIAPATVEAAQATHALSQSARQAGDSSIYQSQAMVNAVAAVQAARIAADEHAQALTEETQKTLAAAQKTNELRAFQADLASIAGAVARGHITSGDAALTLVSKYHLAADAARDLLSAQIAVSGAQGVIAGKSLDEARDRREQLRDRQAGSVAQLTQLRQQRDATNEALAAQTLAIGTDKAKLGVLQSQLDTQRRLHGAQSAEAIQAETALKIEQNRQAEAAKRGRAGGASKGLDALTRDTLNLTDSTADRLTEVNRLLAGGNLTQHQRNQLLIEQQNLQEKIADEQERANRAALDARIGANEDAKKRILEVGELDEARRASRSKDSRVAELGRLKEERIQLEQQKRAADIARDLRTAGVAQPASGAPGAGGAAVSAPSVQAILPPIQQALASAPPQQVVINLGPIVVDAATGKITAPAPTDPAVVLNLLQRAIAQQTRAGL